MADRLQGQKLDELIALLMAEQQGSDAGRFGGQPASPPMGGVQGPLTPEGVRMPQAFSGEYQPQSIDEARAEQSGSAPANPLGYDTPSRFDFANAGMPASARAPSRFDFANSEQPPPIPQDQLNPEKIATTGFPTPTARPEPTAAETGGSDTAFGFGNTANVGPDAFGYAGPWGAGVPTTPEQQRENLARAMLMKPKWSKGGGGGGLF